MNIKKIRDDFPMIKNNPKLAYLDTAATSLIPQVVLDKMNEYYSYYGCSVHRSHYSLGQRATDEYETSRKIIANYINAKEEEIIFTKNATTALNIISLSILKNMNPSDEVIISELSHHSAYLPWKEASLNKKCEIKYVKISDKHNIDIQDFKNKISDKTKVVAISLVSNTFGYLNPINEIMEAIKGKDIITIVDASQAMLSMEVDVQKIGADVLVFSGHKMLGPYCTGILYINKKLEKRLSPVFYGGSMASSVSKDEVILMEPPLVFEAGTQGIAEIIGMASAIQYIEKIGIKNIIKRKNELYNYLLEKVSDIENITIYNRNSDAGILLYNIKNVHPHDAASLYDEDSICVRTGKHCAHLAIHTIGVDSTIRVSLAFYNTKDEIDRFILKTKEIVKFFETEIK